MPTRSLRRRPFWFWPTITFVALVAALLVTAWLAQPRQPLHAGRPLLAWVADLESAQPEVREAAQAAIVTVGTNGISALTWALRKGDSLLGRAVMASEKSLPRRTWFALLRTVKPGDAPRQRATGAKALGLLGSAAEPALPALGELLHDRHLMVAGQAAAAMSAIGPAAVPYLAGALPGASPEVRSHLLLALGKLGPAAAPASPAIMEVLVTGEDRNTPLQAAQTLRRIGPLALPAMVAGLSRTNVGAGERIEAALAELAADQPDAFTALEAELRKAPPAFRPALLRAVQQVTLYPKRRGLIVARTLTDPDPALRAAAADWLRRNSSPVELERPLASEPESLRRLVEEVFRTNRVPAAVEAN